ncbi:MAG: hypothetical protein IID61_10655 [SAR324 cluster bacterium]|nr:hypothetical protein [SAR324 cluster bacterium]
MSAATAIVEAYNTSTDTWATKTPVPTTVHRVSAVSVSRKIYVNQIALHFIYDPTLDGDPAPTGDTAAPADVTGFMATAEDGQVVLDWTNPTDSDFAGVMIRRGTATFPAGIASGVEVFNGAGATFTDTAVTSGTTYFYTAFAFDSVPNHALGSAQATATAF